MTETENWSVDFDRLVVMIGELVGEDRLDLSA